MLRKSRVMAAQLSSHPVANHYCIWRPKRQLNSLRAPGLTAHLFMEAGGGYLTLLFLSLVLIWIVSCFSLLSTAADLIIGR